MTRSLALFAVVGFALTACSNLPSKKKALEIVERDVKEEATCTLDVTTLAQLKMQYTTKAACVPKEGAASAKSCIDALVAAGVTKEKPAEYMRQWPDEVATASLKDIPAFERRARELLFSTCVEMSPSLREGRFPCGTARAKEVVKVSKDGEHSATVRYTRDITLVEGFDRIDHACSGVTKPPAESSVVIEKTPEGWAVPRTEIPSLPSLLPPPGTKTYH